MELKHRERELLVPTIRKKMMMINFGSGYKGKAWVFLDLWV